MQYIISLRIREKYCNSNIDKITKLVGRLEDIAKMLDCEIAYSCINKVFILISDTDITQKVEYDLAIEWVTTYFDIVPFNVDYK